MGTPKQTLGIIRVSLSSLPQRPGPAVVLIISVAGVVAVLASVLAMVSGLSQAMENAGHDDRAVVLRTGSSGEVTSVIQRAQINIIADLPGVLVGADGKKVVSAEAMSPVNLVDGTSGSDMTVTLRGLTQQAFTVWPEMKIVEGRNFQTGLREIIVGKKAQSQFSYLQVGKTLSIYGTEWPIVGIFECGGSARESELMADADTVMAASQRQNYQNVTVRLQSPADFPAFKQAATTNPQLSVEVSTEPEFLSRESSTLNDLLYFVAYVMGGIMAIGAIFVALNAMYTTVSNRSREIGTLRAIGFTPSAIMSAIVVEAALLSVFGGLLGALLAWLFFNGSTANTTIGSDISRQLIFDLHVDSHVLLVGTLWAFVIGVVGGLPPAIRALRMPVTVALRAV